MNEISKKIKSLRSLMSSKNIPAVRLKGVDWFSWATGGGNSVVIMTSEIGVAEVFITPERAWVLTNVIERDRLAHEEVPRDFEIQSFPWQNPGAANEFINKTLDGKPCYSDRPIENEKPLPLEFQYLKMIMTPEEITRYRKVGRLAAEAMTESLTKAEPHWSEDQLAGEGAKALWSRGLDPTLVMVGGERRVQTYRHPIAGSEKLGGCAMMVFCARAYGLYANLTRFIYFRPVTPSERHSFEKVATIEATAFKNSVTDRSLTSVYQSLAEAYDSAGRGEEIHRHHQGGPTGYLSREWTASEFSADSLQLKTGMALAWNPSLTGVKIEDTVLMTEKGLEILTVDPQWPTFHKDGHERPDVWIKYE